MLTLHIHFIIEITLALDACRVQCCCVKKCVNEKLTFSVGDNTPWFTIGVEQDN
jgi:hypothetical protein